MTPSLRVDDPTRVPLLSPVEVAALLRQGSGALVWPESPARPLHGRVGERSAQRLGSGLDYAETRSYQAGDDPRYVHWRATARSGTLQVRKFHQDTSPSVCCVVDRCASMRFGTRRRLKATQAARLALLLAAQEVRQGSELAALVLEPDRHWLPAAVGVAALQRLAERVAAPAPPLPRQRDDRWSPVCGELALRLTPGARVYLISDFRGVREADRRLLADLGRRFDTRALIVYDAVERELPAVGPLLLRWGGVTAPADGRNAAQSRQHADAWQIYRERLQELFASAGIAWRFVPTVEDNLPVVLAEGADGV